MSSAPGDHPDGGPEDDEFSDVGADDTLAGEELGSAEGPPERAPEAVRGRRRLQHGVARSIYSGQALTVSEATGVLVSDNAEVVVLIGEVDAGKTTLLASTYEQLIAGRLDGWQFAGSSSLLGFESRSYLATAASGRSTEDTAHTSRSTEQLLLHLAVRDDKGATRQLLLADVSGEHAKGLRLFDDPGDYAVLLRAATRVLLLVDGAQLTQARDQNLTLANTGTLLRAIAQSGDLRPGTPLDIVVTKWDLCSEASGLDDELERLRILAAGVWAPATLRHTAARPKGEGLAELFDSLLEPRVALPRRRPTRPASDRIAHHFYAHDGLVARLLRSGV